MDVIEESVHAQERVFKESYFPSLYEKALNGLSLKPTDVAERKVDERTLVNLWNTFWMYLPDTPAIRTNLFFKICDICAEMFDDEPTDLDDEVAF